MGSPIPRFLHLLEERGQTASVWNEFQSIAAFLMGDYSRAKQHYKTALNKRKNNRPGLRGVFLKLFDLYFLMGDSGSERYYREGVFGSLD